MNTIACHSLPRTPRVQTRTVWSGGVCSPADCEILTDGRLAVDASFVRLAALRAIAAKRDRCHPIGQAATVLRVWRGAIDAATERPAVAFELPVPDGRLVRELVGFQHCPADVAPKRARVSWFDSRYVAWVYRELFPDCVRLASSLSAPAVFTRRDGSPVAILSPVEFKPDRVADWGSVSFLADWPSE